MNKRYPTILSILIITIMSACGPAPEPTLTAEQIAHTAVADAWIAVTQTAAAMPTATATATPLPPTQTPLPTFTLLPTLPVAATPASGGAAQDACNQPPPTLPKGTQVKAKFINKSGGSVNLSFGMMSPNDSKECVTYSYYMDRFDEVVVTVLTGCYWGWAWVTGDEPSIAKTGDSVICLTDPGKVLTIWVSSETIVVH